MGRQVVDPVLGVWSSHQKHDWAKQVLQSDPEASRRHAYKILGLGSAKPAEDAWWRGARVSMQDAAIVLLGLGVACASPAAAISEWDGTVGLQRVVSQLHVSVFVSSDCTRAKLVQSRFRVDP